jgi:hypothetical protein
VMVGGIGRGSGVDRVLRSEDEWNEWIPTGYWVFVDP